MRKETLIEAKVRVSPEAVELRVAALDFWILGDLPQLVSTRAGAKIYVGHPTGTTEFDHDGRKRWDLLRAALDVSGVTRSMDPAEVINSERSKMNDLLTLALGDQFVNGGPFTPAHALAVALAELELLRELTEKRDMTAMLDARMQELMKKYLKVLE